MRVHRLGVSEQKRRADEYLGPMDKLRDEFVTKQSIHCMPRYGVQWIAKRAVFYDEGTTRATRKLCA